MTHPRTYWEQPVRDVTLAARAEAVQAMATTWTSLVDSLHDRHKELSNIWHEWVEPYWSGDAADAAHAHWNNVADDIRRVAENYGASGPTGAGVPGILRDSAKQINATIDKIPIPLYESDSNPLLPGGRPDELNGGALYRDYDHNRGAYANGEFKQKALDAATSSGHIKNDSDLVSGTRTRPHGYQESTGQADRSRGVLALDSQAYKTYKRLVDAWYEKNQNTANAAYESLQTTYATHGSQLPESIMRWKGERPLVAVPPFVTSDSPPTVTGDSASMPREVASSVGPLGASPDGSSSAGFLPGGVPADAGSGLSSVGSAPTGTSAAGQVGPWTTGSSTPDGVGGPGFRPDVSGAFGTGSAPTDDPAADTVGEVPTAVGPRTAAPIIGSKPGLESSASPGAGFYGGAGAGANRGEQDESTSWLTEDQDIWGLDRDLIPPDGVI